MKKVIAIFGSGPDLGAAVARRFGREGYAVALVARGRTNLEVLADELKNEGIIASSFTADLGVESSIAPVIQEIRDAFGGIDAIYYSPACTEAFLQASECLFTASLLCCAGNAPSSTALPSSSAPISFSK